jgi:hypothetical protein
VRITVSLDTQAVITQPSPAKVKGGASVPLEVVFTRSSQAVTLPEGTSLAFVLKPKNQLTGGTLVLHGDFSLAPSNIYTGTANFFTQPLMALLGLSDDATANDMPQLEAVAELEWTVAAQRFVSATFPIIVESPLRRTNDDTPAALPDLKATQEEAEAGLDNAKWMTPLRTAEAIAALGGGGGGVASSGFILKQASFTAEAGKAYLVGVGPNGGGSSGESGGSTEGSNFSVGSAENEIIVTLPPAPASADAIVILDAFGNWKPTRFGQGVIPAVINMNGKNFEGTSTQYEALPCSCILTFSDESIGWRVTRIETGRLLDLGYGSSLDLCRSYPDALLLKNEQGSPAGWPRFIAQGDQGRTVSFGMSPYGPLINTDDTLRIGQFPSPIRVSQFNTLSGPPIKVPIWNTSGADMAMPVFLGAMHYPDPNAYAPGALYYDTAYDAVLLLVQDARPTRVTLTGTTHNMFANTFDLNGEYLWKYGTATRSAPVYYNQSVPAEIRFVFPHWGIYVNNTLYARCTSNDGAGTYPSGGSYQLAGTNEATNFSVSRDTGVKRWVKLPASMEAGQ